MKSKQATRRALLSSLLSLLLCCSMLLGTTFAWFTDSVTSTGNIIKSGTLDIEMSWADTNSSNESDWKDASEGAIFDYKFWEPGFTQTKYIKIENAGDLAFKYQLNIVPDVKPVAGQFNLADVIDAYLVAVDGAPADRADANAIIASGNGTALSALMADPDGAAYGAMLPKDGMGLVNEDYDIPAELQAITAKGEATYCIILHMREEAGNDYQNLSVGNGFSVQLLATQLTAEIDSFGPDYDAGSEYDNVVPVSNESALRAAIAEGKGVMLAADIAVDSDTAIEIPAGAAIVVDLNGKTISATSSKSGNTDMFLVKGELTVVDGTVEMSTTNNQGWNAMTAIFDVTAGGILNIEDAVINNVGGTDMAFCVHMNNWGEVTLNVDNSTLFSTYGAVRVFNSGNDMNNVTITNSNLIATRALWVHNYTAADFSNNADKAAAAAARLNMNVLVENPVTGLAADDTANINDAAGNTFVGSISYGFTNREVYYSTAKAVVATSNEDFSDALLSSGASELYLGAGSYTLPSVNNKDVTISGTKDAVITIGKPNYTGSDVTLNGVTVKGSGYSTGIQHVNTVTYNDVAIEGEMCLYGEKVVFNNCTFALNNQYIWTYGAKEVEFNNCTFNTNGKAILVYNEGADADTKVTVNGCTFNATAGAKAGAIANQNCAAVEIDSTYGDSFAVTFTGSNVVDSDFSGQWRIKDINTQVTVDGVEYTTLAIDGKSMTRDADKNVTVNN